MQDTDSDNSQRYWKRNLHRFYLLFLIFALCSVFYYIGEIIDFFNWDCLRLGFFYGVHDVHRLIFLIPIIYTAYYFGFMPTIIIIILTICVFMPRALFISPYPDPFLRATLFTLVAAAVGIFIAVMMDKYRKLQSPLRIQQQQCYRILDEMEEYALLIASNHKIVFVNKKMKEQFGDGDGKYCYSYLFNREIRCAEVCMMPDVLKGSSAEFECELSGRRFKVSVLPYYDMDGKVNQLAVLKSI